MRRKRTISIMKLLIISNCIIMALFFSIHLYFSQKNYRDVLEKEIKIQQEQKLQYISEEIDQLVEGIEFLARSAATNRSIVNNILKYKKEKSSYSQNVFQNNMNQNLSDIAYSLDGVVSMNILMDDPQLNTRQTNGVYNYNSYILKEDISEIKKMSSGWIYTRKNNFEIAPYVDYILTYVTKIYSGVYYGDALGHLVVNVDERAFYNRLKLYNQDGDQILIYEKDGNVISSTDREILGKNMQQTDYETYKIQNKMEDETNYSISVVQNYASITSKIEETERFLFRIFLVLFTVFMIFSMIIAYQISRPILHLAKEVTKLKEGQWNKRIKINSRIAEICILSDEFNNKMEKIEKLVEYSIVQEREKRKRDIEILQEQINPHFLYNILETINWMALSKKQKEISNMVVLLGKFLRLSLNKGKNTYLVKDEINHLKYYLEIQNIRCKGKIDVRIEIDDHILEYKMVKLLLQPLVENSILHGFDYRSGVGKIQLRGYEEGRYMFFQVIDDGCGMTEEQIKSVCDLESETGYGLKNVIKRIKLYYGDECGLMIHSKVGQGTRMEVKIRKEIQKMSK